MVESSNSIWSVLIFLQLSYKCVLTLCLSESVNKHDLSNVLKIVFFFSETGFPCITLAFLELAL